MKPLRKAIFPVAGLGTRFLPATKSIPKEMLTVVDRPLIQYAVDEAVEAGIDILIFVTGRSKRSIDDYFDRNPELEAELEAKGKMAALDIVRNVIPPHVKCVFVRQSQPLGLGHKIARIAIAPGAPVIKYGAPIGRATQAIAPGDHVHLHNLKSDYTPTYALEGKA